MDVKLSSAGIKLNLHLTLKHLPRRISEDSMTARINPQRALGILDSLQTNLIGWEIKKSDKNQDQGLR